MSGESVPSIGVERESDRTRRLLALEGRNALSRVELAASELAGCRLVPAQQELVRSIHEAVADLDWILDRLDGLDDVRRRVLPALATPVAPAWTRVATRVAPSLAARGIRLGRSDDPSIGRVAVPEAVLERLLLLGVRTAVAAVESEGSTGSMASIELRGATMAPEGGPQIELCIAGSPRSSSFRLSRPDRIELDVALAEWGGSVVCACPDREVELAIRLPRGQSDA